MSNATMSADKRALRREYKTRRESISASERARFDAAVCANLTSLPELLAPSLVAAYVGDGTEPDLKGFLQPLTTRGIPLAFPRCAEQNPDGIVYELAKVADLETGWTIGAYGLREPDGSHPRLSQVERNQGTAVWLIPGVAFTRAGARLGRGKSVYDRLMTGSDAVKIGIFYACQEADALPEEAHDRRLDIIVTESEIIRCRLPLKQQGADA